MQEAEASQGGKRGMLVAQDVAEGVGALVTEVFGVGQLAHSERIRIPFESAAALSVGTVS